jgi:opacity protein-like surface antigen
MKIIYAFLFAALLCTATVAQAQNGDDLVYKTKGFSLNASLLGASWTMDDLGIDADNGGGLGLKLGYNFSSYVGVFTSLNAALMNPDEDEYVLAHFDIGLQGTFRPDTARLRPYLNVAASGMTAQDDEIEINGAGVSLGGGALIFLSRNLALDIGYTHGLIELTETKLGSQTFEIEESATTMRLFVGFGWYF